jgi:hypothetical protein
MRTIASTLVFGLFVFCVLAGAQTFHTNGIDSAQAIKISSGLKVGMSEGEVGRFLETNGLTGEFTIGSHVGGTRSYLLSDGCTLCLDISLKSGSYTVAWTNRILRAASIQSNGVKIVSIILTNAP